MNQNLHGAGSPEELNGSRSKTTGKSRSKSKRKGRFHLDSRITDVETGLRIEMASMKGELRVEISGLRDEVRV